MLHSFKSHLKLAHEYWHSYLQKGDIAIDATCGNGHDSLILANLILTEETGKLYAIDIHPHAIKLTKELLEKNIEKDLRDRIEIVEGCHSTFPSEILPESVRLIVYNLGYLPGLGNKSHTTLVETTLESINKGMILLRPGGLLSITCYPGHPEGANEENHIVSFAKALDKKCWSCCYHQWINRPKSPSLLLIQKNENNG